MLTLTRKIGEVIRIGEATVTVIDIRRGQVKLGVTAPREIEVDREEVRRAKDQRKREGDAHDRD